MSLPRVFWGLVVAACFTLMMLLFRSPSKPLTRYIVESESARACECAQQSPSDARFWCAFPLPRVKRREGKDKWVISYSLYGGDKPRYVDTLKKTVSVISKTLFPEWTVRIYHDGSLSAGTQEFLTSHGAELVLGPSGIKNPMVWRFLPASDPLVARFISRDADSYLTLREKWAVEEWVASNKSFHNMRDHPSGSLYTMMGGMWGAVRGVVPNIEGILAQNRRQGYMEDMKVIEGHIWPLLSENAMQHDAFTCADSRFKGGQPFPYPRIGPEIIGGVVVDAETGATRQGDIDLLLAAKSPPECTPVAKPLRVVSPVGHKRVEIQCVTRSLGTSCQVALARIQDVFVDWDSVGGGEGYGVMFDAETVFTPRKLSVHPISIFERDSKGLMEGTKWYPRLAHVLVPHADDEPWVFPVLVLPRFLMLLERLDPAIPVLLVRTPEAEAALLVLEQWGLLNMKRVVWHAGSGRLNYAHELWFALPLSNCSACSFPDHFLADGTGEGVVSCGDDAVSLGFSPRDTLNEDATVGAVIKAISTAKTFVCSARSRWMGYLVFLPSGGTVVEVGNSRIGELREAAASRQLTYVSGKRGQIVAL